MMLLRGGNLMMAVVLDDVHRLRGPDVGSRSLIVSKTHLRKGVKIVTMVTSGPENVHILSKYSSLNSREQFR